MSSRGLHWVGGIIAGVAVGGLAFYLATSGWEKASWVASVVSLSLTVVSVVLGILGEIRARRAVPQGGRPPVSGTAPAKQALSSSGLTEASGDGREIRLPGSVKNMISSSHVYGVVAQSGAINSVNPPGTHPSESSTADIVGAEGEMHPGPVSNTVFNSSVRGMVVQGGSIGSVNPPGPGAAPEPPGSPASLEDRQG